MANIIKFFGTLTFFLLVATHATAQNPIIHPSVINLGEVSSPTAAVATLRNTTAKPLLITKIESDCHCTKTTYSRQPIQSGDSTKITVRYTPTTSDGAFYKAITVHTTASKEPLKFILRGTNL